MAGPIRSVPRNLQALSLVVPVQKESPTAGPRRPCAVHALLRALRLDLSERPGLYVQRSRAAPGECQVEEETEGVHGTELGGGLARMSEETEAFLLRRD